MVLHLLGKLTEEKKRSTGVEIQVVLHLFDFAARYKAGSTGVEIQVVLHPTI